LSVVSCQLSVVFQQRATHHLPPSTDPYMALMTPRTEKPRQQKPGPDPLPRTRFNRVHILYDREKVSSFSPGIC